MIQLVEPTASVLARHADPDRLLSAPELDRAQAIGPPADRDDFIAGHLLVREAAAQLLDRPVAEMTIVQWCDSCQKPHGRPQLLQHNDIGLSLSHCAGWVAAVATTGPCGIDIQTVASFDWITEPGQPPTLAQGLHPQEVSWIRASPNPARAFASIWVQKEALVKASGLRLDDMHEISLVRHAELSQEHPSWQMCALVLPTAKLVGALVVSRAG